MTGLRRTLLLASALLLLAFGGRTLGLYRTQGRNVEDIPEGSEITSHEDPSPEHTTAPEEVELEDIPAFRHEDEPTEEPATQPETALTFEPAGDPSRYHIEVDVTLQRVYVYQDQELIWEMEASTGMPGHETPLGTFHIQNRGEWFFSEKYGQGAMYWVSFRDWGIYLFHSLAMDKDQVVIAEEAEKLGEPASHGCIRLAIDDALWIYENVPTGTEVTIHD